MKQEPRAEVHVGGRMFRGKFYNKPDFERVVVKAMREAEAADREDNPEEEKVPDWRNGDQIQSVI